MARTILAFEELIVVPFALTAAPAPADLLKVLKSMKPYFALIAFKAVWTFLLMILEAGSRYEKTREARYAYLLH